MGTTAATKSPPRVEPLSACPVCAGVEWERAFDSPDFLHGVPGRYSYVTCCDCRTVFQNPAVLIEDLPGCYPGDYFTHASPGGGNDVTPPSPDSARDRMRKAILHHADGTSDEGLSAPLKAAGALLSLAPRLRRRARFGLIDELKPEGSGGERCLEVGSGQGVTLRALKWAGWEPTGLDLDPAAAATARQTSGCEVRVGTLVESDFAPGSFKLIYMSHVVEHLPDLRSSLERCRELLAAGGRLVMIYPNPRALTVKYYGAYSCVWDPPRHLVLPTPEALVQLLGRLGFGAIRSRTLAARAAGFRIVSRIYRDRDQGREWDGRGLRTSDRLFGLWEALCVAAGAPVGEEVIVVAEKS